jgi:dTDP-glucose 4,6-dehydratase
MKVVYITGCLGFIGSHVTRECLNLGWYVMGVDKMTYASNKELLKEFNEYKNFTFVKSDINDLKFLYDCDYLINTAAETHVGNSISNSNEFVSSNINGVHNLLELIRTYRLETSKTPVLLHFSTDEVYGDIVNGEHSEDDLLKPSNPYSATKSAADQLIVAWGRTYNLPYVIIRPTNNYGIGQYVEKLIPKTCKYLILGRKIPLHNNGTPIRNWLHAEDTARAVITIINSNKINEIFNISSNFEQTNYETVSKIVKIYHGKDDPSEFIDSTYSRPGMDMRYSLNDSKLRSLGWFPLKKFDEEIPKIIEYYKNRFIW